MYQITRSNFYVLLLVFSLLFILVLCDDEESEDNITIQEAEQILYIDLLDSNDSGIVVYELPYIMKSGNTVKAKGGDSTYVVQKDSWFFFIDDKPGYRWVHPCRYVFIDCYIGDLLVVDERNEPEIIDSLVIVNF